MAYVLEQFEHAGKFVRIVSDDDPLNPRVDWDNLGKILYMASSRYILGDEAVEHEEIKAIAERSDVIWLPVYAYIHSGIAMNTTGFSCPWDSGQSGIIYVEKEAIRKEWGVKRISPKLRATIEMVLKSEIECYDQFLNGDVWGYEVMDEEDGTVLESCWGFFGSDYCIEEAKSVAEIPIQDFQI